MYMLNKGTNSKYQWPSRKEVIGWELEWTTKNSITGFCLKSTILKYNLHIIKCTHFQCAILWPPVKSKSISVTPKTSIQLFCSQSLLPSLESYNYQSGRILKTWREERISKTVRTKGGLRWIYQLLESQVISLHKISRQGWKQVGFVGGGTATCSPV